MRDLGGIVLGLVARPMTKVFGSRDEDPNDMRRYAGGGPSGPYTPRLRNSFRAFAWAFVAGCWAVSGIVLVNVVRLSVGDLAGDRVFAIMLGGVVAIIAMALLSGARAALAGRFIDRGTVATRLGRFVVTPSNIDIL